VLTGFHSQEKPITQHPFAKQFCWSNWDSLGKIRSKTGNKNTHLRKLAQLAVERQQMMQKRLAELQTQIDDEVYLIYQIDEEDKKRIERELASRRGDISFHDEEEEGGGEEIEATMDQEARIKEHIARLLSFYIKKTLELDPDGVVPLPEMVERLRKKIADDFGKDQVDAKEKEMQEVLGKSLLEWVATDYFDFHVDLYKRRPIIWHLSSSNFSASRGFWGTVNIFLHYHKLDRDTIPKILTNYLKSELEATRWKSERLKRELQEARNQNNRTKDKELSKQLETCLSILEELQAFQKALEAVHNPRSDKTKLPKNPTWLQQKIAEVRDNGYSPVIDYGVRVNIEPLKEAGLLHKAVQRVK